MKVVTMGGGGGHSQILKALKNVPDVQITGICPSTDSGGSTGRLQEDYDASGYLGDLTKCIAALCPDPVLAQALSYRFQGGCLNGHTVKNMLFLGMEKSSGVREALLTMFRICGIEPHRVFPVTYERTKLCATLKFGQKIEGETQIDLMARNPLFHPDHHAITDIHLQPSVQASEDAVGAVMDAEWIVVCPGDLYSSILPVMLPAGMCKAIKTSKAKIVMVLNIMTKSGETDKYGAMDFVSQVERRLGRPCDVILANSSDIPQDLLFRYRVESKVQLTADADSLDRRVRLAPLAHITDEGFVYHNPDVLAVELTAIFE